MIGYTLLILVAIVVLVALSLTMFRHRGSRAVGRELPEKPVIRSEPASDEPTPEPGETVNPSSPQIDRRLPPS